MTTNAVFSVSHGFQMVGVDASGDAAKVVQFKAITNRPVEKAIEPAVCGGSSPTFVPKHAVFCATSRLIDITPNCTLPEPTGSEGWGKGTRPGRKVYLRPEPISSGSRFSASFADSEWVTRNAPARVVLAAHPATTEGLVTARNRTEKSRVFVHGHSVPHGFSRKAAIDHAERNR